MPRQTVIEVLHIFAGLVATAGIVALSAWAYPLARREITVVGWAVAGIVVLLGVNPVRRAWAQDRRSHDD